MIAHLTGRVIHSTLDSIILDVHGVGYLVHVPIGTLGRLTPDAEERISLHVHTSVREDAIQLYGFASFDTKRLFNKLTTVTGVGPKLALSVLSELEPSEVVMAVHTNNVATLTRASGVGKKTAQRLILELKNSLDDISFGELTPQKVPAFGVADDLRSALTNLGFAPAMIDATIERLLPDGADSDDGDQDMESLMRQALKMIRSTQKA